MHTPLSARSVLPRIPPWLFAAAVSLNPLIALAAPKKGGAALPEAVANEAVNSDSFTSRPLILILALAAMGLVPFALMMVTSFVKISVVLSIVRSALGTQQIPPTQVITGLAVILTVYIMAPVGMEMYRAGGVDIWAKGPGVFSSETVGSLLGAADKSKEPLRSWLMKKVTNKDRSLFFNLAKKLRKGEDRDAVQNNDFMVIIPAFVVSELKEAFQIGFLLFVPFIVIDMVVANILLALGMHMLSPTTISMPFKLLLFVLVDGWYLIAKGLVVGYL
ncbi:type III secretion system export apparatus subunit SctR [Pyxidicoccus parkwayensis]|uniref:Type III secretion system export apparatus subunit SctR n=1 Tax=Pyxidicoccus parkwayensis TaxID=2813578 RepID=A0ABX7NII5_9BACT|nr:type III secretion system export apparatus subunit SctR [Pyxidicoccus parkwaysis]QSQ18675.1 type III secretion system export apparatus subunit SctR [Pyxidicoccus parkwaysis]